MSKFLSTPSARRATGWFCFTTDRIGNFYPRPPRGGRLLCFLEIAVAFVISIHALREEGDACLPGKNTFTSQFLSTPSARRATEFSLPICVDVEISIHALREEGDPHEVPQGCLHIHISIHALREEGDRKL